VQQRHTKRRRVQWYLMTRALEDGARNARSPERFIMLLAIPVEDRRSVEAEALAAMLEGGRRYTDTLYEVVVRYLDKQRKCSMTTEQQVTERRRVDAAQSVREARRRDSERWGDCGSCLDVDGPRHAGSSRCESGAIAAGGNRAHCTCDVCY
jgi:hypothetical protein